MESSQKNVFDVAAKDIVKQFLEGYNATIFAYGETGAGKTYTIQGEGVEGLNGGLIPQSLSKIFQEVDNNQHETVNIHVSFLEIYKETAYDLLGPLLLKGSRKTKELSKVLVTMGGNDSCHLHGLSYHHVTSEDEAAQLYRLGVANQKTDKTSDNQRSSRSHTVFSITISRQRHGTELFLRSKLNLVDLAGSEHVWKSSADEQQPGEAKFVNLSLHHLESVIIALQKFNMKSLRNCSRKKQTGKVLKRSSSATLRGERSVDAVPKSRFNEKLTSASAVELGKGKHSGLSVDYEPVLVPYRNSLLTMVLQDSLGGNCITAMIAALSFEEKNLSETISTCRFAQRVARIMNKPIRNEEVDKNMVIRRLQTTLAKLHLELANYKHESLTLRLDDESSPEDEQDCSAVMRSFLAGRINDPVSHGINTPRKFRTSLRYLRRIFAGTTPQALRDGDQEQQSADDRDSGVRTGSEPTSPLTSEGETDVHVVSNFIAQLPSPVPMIADASQHRLSVTQESGISLGTEHEEPTPDADESSPGPSHEIPQMSGPGTSEVSTQTGLLKTCEGRKSAKKDVCLGEGKVQPAGHGPREDVLIWELELQKEELLNKSKMFTSRLADQRARLVVMLRRGDLPEELENEKIVELQLQKKQREVESKLSFVIKKLADLKYTDRLKQCQVKAQHQSETQSFKELELKEVSTRQKLLARREQMRNFGLSSPTLSHQSAPSTSSFRSGTGSGNVTLSRTSSMTLHWEDGGRETGDQYRTVPGSPISSIPASNSRNSKPVASRRELKDNSRKIHHMALSSQSFFSKRGFSSQERFYSRDKSGTSRNVGKNCPLVDYMNNSHRALYHKSTFPRRIENGVCSDLRGTKSAQRTMPKKQKACGNSEAILARSSLSCLQSKEQSSDSSKTECIMAMPPDAATTDNKLVTANDASEDQAEISKQEDKCSDFKNSRLSSPGETAASKSRENFQEQKLPCLNREQRVRVLKIREYVSAAEVIQRRWRLYKMNRKGEGGK
ncbi:hypothetical protein ACROYT_G036563 [Oculina patagonica]